MAKKRTSRKSDVEADPLDYATPASASRAAVDFVHIIRDSVVCKTDKRGYAEPDNRSPAEIVVDASEGFIPLWADNVTLRWRFQEQSMQIFRQPELAKQYIQELFGNAILLWGDAPPVKFIQRDDRWDFEIAMKPQDDCDANGCVLASAFFPDAGRHELNIYPKMFEQSDKEQIETMAHEIGHIFGLRHFFAKIRESRWSSEIFGTHNPFSIMNYGTNSFMTDNDKSDLKKLYSMARNGSLTEINGTPIKLVLPFSLAADRSCQSDVKAVANVVPLSRQSTCQCCGSRLA